MQHFHLLAVFHRTYFLKYIDCTNAKVSDYRSTNLRRSMMPSSQLPAMGVCMLTRKQSHRKKVNNLAALQSNTVLIKELSILKIYT
jgi:plasmid rolling circle replication initiator protein Rep